MLAGYVSAQPTDERALRQAVQLKDWPEIERLLTKMNVGATKDANLLRLLTLSLVQQNKADKAVEQARRALSADSTRLQSWLMLAECQGRLNQRDAVIRTLERAVQRFPDSVQATWALGIAYVKNGNFQGAIPPLEDVMFRRSDPSVMYELARCYFKTGQFNAASELNLLLVDRFPDIAPYHVAAGETLLAIKNAKQAVVHFERAIALDSSLTEPYLLLTGALQELGDSTRALATSDLAVKRYPQDPMAWYNLGLLRMKHNMHDSAVKALKRAVSLRQNYGEAYFNLALAYEHKGFIEDAINAFKRCALVSAPLAPDAYNSAAIVYRRAGNLAEALNAHQQAIALRDTSSVLHVSRLNSCYEAERCDLAVPFIKQALDRFPENGQVLFSSLKCLVRIGQRERVAELLPRLEKIAPDLAAQVKSMIER